jgi:transcription initiation factor IIE alpha subunit
VNPKKFHESCPDCGLPLTLDQAETLEHHKGFDCERCKAHYASEDFAKENSEKAMAQFHNSAKADLTNESDDHEQ